MPDLHDNRAIEWKVHVTKSLGAYDMIIGRDMMDDLGIDIRIHDSGQVAEAADRIKGILDAKYEQADLREVVNLSVHLDSEEQVKLYQLLT